ncbi:MAG: hypothetical protein SXQ77_12880 [Halobacteria archaeon]|nr:hypothetical protein [Halobacteria archaeon]
MTDADNLKSRVRELEATVDALTDDLVDMKERIDELEGGDNKNNRDEVGVGVDEEEESDDIYVA